MSLLILSVHICTPLLMICNPTFFLFSFFFITKLFYSSSTTIQTSDSIIRTRVCDSIFEKSLCLFSRNENKARIVIGATIRSWEWLLGVREGVERKEQISPTDCRAWLAERITAWLADIFNWQDVQNKWMTAEFREIGLTAWLIYWLKELKLH